MNRSIGREPETTVVPLLQRLYRHSESNSRRSKKGFRYDDVVKRFAVAVYILNGSSGYDLIRSNFSKSLPHCSIIQKVIGKQKKLNEGEFHFDELCKHLKKWESPPFVHLHLDDTRIINKIEYDPLTDRFVGFVLPINNDGIPLCDTFVLSTYESIKEAFENKSKGKYAHVMVAKPVNNAPTLILFMLCTDAKYNHEVVIRRWKYVEIELKKRGITIISNGADGAGPFLKAMTISTSLFSLQGPTIPSDWTFFLMPKLLESGMCSQDVIHLLAKLRTRLLTPSNVIVMGTEVACRGHLHHLLKFFNKSRHGLTQQILENKDKQNYKSIDNLLNDEVKKCLFEKNDIMKTEGTITYLDMMRNIRDAFLDRGLTPLKRVYLMWEAVFFFRIWRKWLCNNNYSPNDHFVTQNVYVCTELNGHMILNIIYNVVKGKYPVSALRVWTCGSQGCEEVFRLLRSMTPTFSTVVNFSMKGVLERAHKLNFLVSIEASEDIVVPRTQRRLLQIKNESEGTFKVPSFEEVTESVKEAKKEAIRRANALGMVLPSYNDKDLIFYDNKSLLTTAFEIDYEDDLTMTDSNETYDFNVRASEEVISIRDDVSRIYLEKQTSLGVPTYVPVEKSGKQSGRVYSLTRKKDATKSAFVKYGSVYIRKTTALYILQENPQLSNDRLLRVRSAQPTHLFSGISNIRSCLSGPQKRIFSGDLCVFKRVDDEKKKLIGRIIQFSYMEGSKKAREYSSSFVETTLLSASNIGALANWYQGVSSTMNDPFVSFKPLNSYYDIGYHSIGKFYNYSIDESCLNESTEFSFAIHQSNLSEGDENWRSSLSFDFDF